MIMESVELLCAPKKLERDRGEAVLKEALFSNSEIKSMHLWIMEKSENLHNWEDIFGSITLSRILFEKISPDLLESFHFRDEICKKLPEFYSHGEYRVRIAAGELIGQLCFIYGIPIFNEFLPAIKEGIQQNLDRDPLSPQNEVSISTKELQLAMDRDPNLSKSSLSIFHDTAGWKNLETWMKCLHFGISGLGAKRFGEFRDPQILTLIFSAVNHTNRFVRETGYDLLGTVIENHGCQSTDKDQSTPDFIRVAQQLAIGLADNWSQVRMASSQSTRKFFNTPPPPNQTFEAIYSILLPPMCLNRFYIAEGVRLFSQTTWSQITNGKGRELITSVLDSAVAYYISQTDANNHAVREAACAALAEIGTKLSADALKPHLPQLLESLVGCFNDDSWPVRDAACVALGNIISVFPNETRDYGHSDLMADRFLRNLTDSIPSVREGAASAIASITSSAKDSDLDMLYIQFINKQLQAVTTQSSDSKRASSESVSRGPGASVLVHTEETAHDKQHTNQTMYSCGSLAPKMSKGGCFDGHFQRPSEPWERADGAFRLIGELSIKYSKVVSDKLIDAMITAASFTQYPHYPYLLETACQTIKKMSLGLEKIAFKRNLDSLLPVLSWAISSELPLAENAAIDCLDTLSLKLGPNVIRSRISNHFEISTVPKLLKYLPEV